MCVAKEKMIFVELKIETIISLKEHSGNTMLFGPQFS
jgi:hypothetical protein